MKCPKCGGKIIKGNPTRLVDACADCCHELEPATGPWVSMDTPPKRTDVEYIVEFEDGSRDLADFDGEEFYVMYRCGGRTIAIGVTLYAEILPRETK